MALAVSDLLGKTPAPLQLALFASTANEVGMITGIGAGKTRGFLAKALYHGANYPGAKVLLGRLVSDEVVNTVKDVFFEMATPLHKLGWFDRPARWDFREGTNFCRMVNGSEFYFAQVAILGKFLNEEFSFIAIDQAEQIPEKNWENLTSRIRLACVPSEAWQAIAAANDDGHNWIWKRFVYDPPRHRQRPDACPQDPQCMLLAGHPDADGIEHRDWPCTTREFLHATTLSNTHNLKPKYLSDLLSRPRNWQKRMVFAMMEGAEGAALPPPVVLPYHLDPPLHWPRYFGYDHSLTSPACGLWVAVNSDTQEWQGVPPNGRYVYREYWAESSSVDQHARRILAMKQTQYGTVEKIEIEVMDASAFSRTQTRPHGIRKSYADIYAEEGLQLIPAKGSPHDRLEGILRDCRRGLVLSPACPHLIEQWPQYATAEAKDGSMFIVQRRKFHSLDALGYVLLAIPATSPQFATGVQMPAVLQRVDLDPLSRVHHYNEWQRQQEEAAMKAGERNAAEFLGHSVPLVPFGYGDEAA